MEWKEMASHFYETSTEHENPFGYLQAGVLTNAG